MGETNALAERHRGPLPRAVLHAAEQLYRQYFSDKDRLTATFELVFLHGWVPHDSQQKPLRPGTATQRLADALGTKEHKGKD